MSVDSVPPMRDIKSNQLNMAATHTHRATLDVICRDASCIDLLSEEGQRGRRRGRVSTSGVALK